MRLRSSELLIFDIFVENHGFEFYEFMNILPSIEA